MVCLAPEYPVVQAAAASSRRGQLLVPVWGQRALGVVHHEAQVTVAVPVRDEAIADPEKGESPISSSPPPPSG